MSDLVIPGGDFMPSNLRVPPELRNAHVEGDMYNICERVKEISRALFVVPLIDDPHGFRIAVGEVCEDGVERLVFRVRELDARVLNKLAELMNKPLSERLAEIEKAEFKFIAEERDREMEELYENVGAPMWSMLERCGFIDRPVSYPKKGIKPNSDKGADQDSDPS